MIPEELIALFIANLRSIREEAGFSQSELARRTGMTPSYICDLERGRRKPNLGTLAPLAAALGVAPSTLISTIRSPVADHKSGG